MHPTIVIPTRNRAHLAAAAIESVLDQGVDGLSVIVSDNSTEESQRDELGRFVKALADDRVSYVAPAEPLPMTAHWQWAMDRALADPRTTHVIYLTDRMVMRRGGLRELVEIANRHPADVVTYTHDELVDHTTPVRLHQQQWTGWLLRVDAAHLARLGRAGEFPLCLPRMLNCLVPRRTVEEVARRFGSVFASISPDYCFAFRCLEAVDSILYWDKALLVHYALDRSHGFSYARGADTPDRRSFVADLDGGRMNASTPIPEFEVVTNALFNEYFFVQAEPGSRKLPPVPRHGYLAALYGGVAAVEDPQRRGALETELERLGWRWRGARGRAKVRRYGILVAFYARRPRTFARRLALLWQRTALGRARLEHAVARGDLPPPGVWLEFDDRTSAVARARGAPPRRSHDLAHIPTLVEPPSAAEVISGPATTPPSG